METFGERLRMFRMKKGLTQTQLAEGIVTPSMLSQVEANKAKPSWHVLEQIAKKLEISVDELIGNSKLDMAVISEYRLAKGMLSAGEFSSALPILKKIMEDNTGKLDPFEIRYDHAFCLLHLHQLHKAEEAFQQLLNHTCTVNGSLILTVRVLHQLGHVAMKQKRYQIAEHYLTLALDKIRSLEKNDVHLQSSLLLTLGEVQKRSGHLKKARVTLQLALPIFEEREDLRGLGELYLKLAQSSRATEDYAQASDFAHRAQLCFTTLNDQKEKLALQLQLALLNGETGDVEKAIHILEQVAEAYRRLQQSEEAGVAVTELAKLYFKRGNLDQAEEACQTARSLLPTVHPYQAWVANVYAKIAQSRNQQAAAVKYMKQAADCFKLTECQAEYEETMQELSRLYEANHDCQSALRVMHEMWSFNRQVREQRGIVL
ncbi:helix-turn-helix domain-containing protein [Tumebacillus flagellatus]|uniref:HTH cro/C1-type domain-containing protein n=1 Tax=Tumebacillus flagellatus TaxID=1157490 RepID=A0A074LW42_9BACL|nr:helix-turn-helix transcriptional regulator [Tumebacillus flagellatus]KEO84263.1 hypothetical protein EL26_05720 [Tumebacillus flagellatus]